MPLGRAGSLASGNLPSVRSPTSSKLRASGSDAPSPPSAEGAQLPFRVPRLSGWDECCGGAAPGGSSLQVPGCRTCRAHSAGLSLALEAGPTPPHFTDEGLGVQTGARPRCPTAPTSTPAGGHQPGLSFFQALVLPRPPGLFPAAPLSTPPPRSCLLRCLPSNLLLRRTTGVEPSGLSTPAQHRVSILYPPT